MLDATRDDLTLGVVGTGTMGRGIAQVAAAGGLRVLLHDSLEGAAEAAVAFIGKMLDRAEVKGRLPAGAAAAARARLEIVDRLAGLAPCQVVIEAVSEDLELKCRLFRELEGVVDGDCVLATNTSSLSVTSIAAACARPERVGGLHFFNPVPLMALVEVVAGVHSAPWVVDALMTLGRRLGREPVRVADAPGFLVNQVGRGYTLEAAHLAGEKVADFATIDRILREQAGFPLGPFELMDLTGLDVTQPASESIYRRSYDEPRYRPSPLMGLRLEAGLLGRKTGRGFYSYDSGDSGGSGPGAAPVEAPVPAYDGRPVWVSPAEPEAARALAALIVRLGANRDDGARPGARSLILVTPLGEDATTAAVDQDLDPARSLAVDTLFGLDRRRVLMKTPVGAPDAVAAVQGLLALDGTPVSVLRDSCGFVAQRIVATIVNIGSAVAQQAIATPRDIDKAIAFGLGYPQGRLAFGDRLGPAKILRVLQAMHRITGDPRYRPSPWLTRRARLGVSLLTPED
jgi:3-hydroxybutyryl-CoA dehydrogenase